MEKEVKGEDFLFLNSSFVWFGLMFFFFPLSIWARTFSRTIKWKLHIFQFTYSFLFCQKMVPFYSTRYIWAQLEKALTFPPIGVQNHQTPGKRRKKSETFTPIAVFQTHWRTPIFSLQPPEIELWQKLWSKVLVLQLHLQQLKINY